MLTILQLFKGTLKYYQDATIHIIQELSSQSVSKPRKLRLMKDSVGNFQYPEYYPLCQDDYFDWLLCHTSYSYNISARDLSEEKHVPQVMQS